MVRSAFHCEVGKLVYYKGFEFLVEAMKGQCAKLLIVGSGPLEKPLLGLSRAHGVADRVHIIASVPDLTPYYDACELFGLPSVPPRDASALAEAIGQLLGDAALRNRLGAAAMARIGTHFDLDRFVDRVAEEVRAG